MHVVFLCLESNKYFFTILIVFVLGLTFQLKIIIVLSFALPDRHLTSIYIWLKLNMKVSAPSKASILHLIHNA
jgi:hypothetical protein